MRIFKEYVYRTFSINWTFEKAKERLIDFITLNIEAFIISDIDNINSKNHPDNENAIIACFVINAFEEQNKNLISYIEKITQGVMCYQFIFYKGDSDKDLSNLEVFIDSPLAMYALGYTGDLRKEIALELINKLKENNAKIKIYEHNIQEIRNNLYACKKIIDKKETAYGEGKFTVEYFMNLPYSLTAIDDAIYNVEEELEKISIETENNDLYVEKNYNKVEDEKVFLDKLKEKMEGETHGFQSVETDFKSVMYTKIIRGKQKSKNLKEAKAIFITKNRVLSYVSSKFFKEYEPYIPTVITHCKLSTRLILLNGILKPELPINIVLERCYASVFPSDDTWKNFIKYINEKLDKGEIEDVDYIKLRSRDTIRNDIKRLEIKESSITAASFDEIIKDDKERQKKEFIEQQEKQKREFEEKQNSQQEKHKEEMEQNEKEKNELERLLEASEKEKKRENNYIRIRASKKYRRRNMIVDIAIPIIIIIMVTLINTLTSYFHQNIGLFWSILLSIIVVIISTIPLIINFKKRQKIEFDEKEESYIDKYIRKEEEKKIKAIEAMRK